MELKGVDPNGLRCTKCMEPAMLVRDKDQWYVWSDGGRPPNKRKRTGVCCQSLRMNTIEAAVRAWETMHD